MTERIRGQFKTTGKRKIRIGTNKEGKPIYVWSDGDISNKLKINKKKLTV